MYLLRLAYDSDAPSLSLSVSTSTNRVTSSGYSYDSFGNLTADPTYNYTWNAEEGNM